MKKNNPIFTKSLTTVLKKSERIACQKHENGYLICNGFCIWLVSPAEYTELVQPVTACPAGNWEYTSAGIKDGTIPDIAGFWKKYIEPEKGMIFGSESFARFDFGAATATAIYSNNVIAILNYDYLKTVQKSLRRIITDEKSPVVFVEDDFSPRAIVLPIKAKPEVYAAVAALHGMTATAEVDTLREELEKTKSEYCETLDMWSAQKAAAEAAQAEAAALREALEAAKAAQQPATVEAEKKTAEAVAARFADLPGLVVTVKGAQTAAPVLWFSGAVAENTVALKEAGARWSERRSAYYLKIA